MTPKEFNNKYYTQIYFKTGLYYIYCLKNEKIYIGQSIDIPYRIKRHKYKLNVNKHANQHLQNAWNLYGKENFIFSPIEETNKEELTEKELYYASLFDKQDLFNINTITASFKRNFSKEKEEEISKKISEKKKGQIISKETREKISKANKGKKCSEETKKKLSQANKGNKRWLGKSHSEETKQKMSKAAKLRKPSVIRENFNDIKTKLENGYLIKDIASFYNVNPHTVYKVISDNNYIRKEHDPNVRKKLKGREKTEEEKRKNSLSKAGLYDKKEDIFKRRINGETIKNIASFYKVSPTTIWAILNPDKVKLKQQNRKPKKLF